jgi:hypothetical protein
MASRKKAAAVGALLGLSGPIPRPLSAKYHADCVTRSVGACEATQMQSPPPHLLLFANLLHLHLVYDIPRNAKCVQITVRMLALAASNGNRGYGQMARDLCRRA